MGLLKNAAFTEIIFINKNHPYKMFEIAGKITTACGFSR